VGSSNHLNATMRTFEKGQLIQLVDTMTFARNCDSGEVPVAASCSVSERELKSAYQTQSQLSVSITSTSCCCASDVSQTVQLPVQRRVLCTARTSLCSPSTDE
jgi:hypothetical protein